MRVLITGAAGFVGAHLARHCLERGDAVLGLARSDDDASRLDPLGPRVALVRANLLDPGAAERAVRAFAPEGCVHLAAQSSVQASMADPVGTWDANVRGTQLLYEAFRAAAPAARIAFVGSGDVYGAVPPERLPVSEGEPFAPQNPYAASKAAADLLSEQYFRVFGLAVTRLRPFNHTGPGQPRGFIVPDLASQVAAIEAGGSPPVLRAGDLDPEKDFTDVRDMVVAYRLALERAAPGAAYNLGSGRRVRIGDLVSRLVSLARIPIRVEQDPALLRKGRSPCQEADAGAFHRATGWAPRIPLETTLRDVLDEWRAKVATIPA